MSDEERCGLPVFTGQADQDRATCEAWWVATTAQEKFAIWELIVKRYEDPAMIVMCRFAQLIFSEMVAKHGMHSKPSKPPHDSKKEE